MRPASVASSLWASAGTWSMTPAKLRWSMTKTVMSVWAVTVAVTGPPVEQRELADHRPRTERRDLASVALHRRSAIDDDECLTALLALVDQRGAGLHGDLVRRLCDLLEVLGGAGCEQRDARQVVEIRLPDCHGGASY